MFRTGGSVGEAVFSFKTLKTMVIATSTFLFMFIASGEEAKGGQIKDIPTE
jgi:hypothetical protein